MISEIEHIIRREVDKIPLLFLEEDGIVPFSILDHRITIIEIKLSYFDAISEREFRFSKYLIRNDLMSYSYSEDGMSKAITELDFRFKDLSLDFDFRLKMEDCF